MPVIVPFFKSNGLNMKEVMLLQSIMAVSIVVMEIPSGYLGDLFGRKWSIACGVAFGFLGMLVMGFANDFWSFTIAEIFLGIGASFVSGADSALLYDSLLNDKRSDEFIQYQGRLTSIGSLSESLAGILGGLMAAWWIRSPVFLHSFILLFSFFLALSLKEPERKKMKASETTQNFINVFKFIWQHPQIKWWLLYTAIVGTATLTTAWIIQPYLIAIEIDLKYFGFWWTALNLMVALGAYFSNAIHQRLPVKWLVQLMLLFILLSMVLAGWAMAIYGMTFFFLINFIRGVKEPILKDYINRYTASEMRATVLSINSFLIRGVFAVFGPWVGWMLDVYDFKWAMITSTIVLFILGILIIFMLFRSNALKK